MTQTGSVGEAAAPTTSPATIRFAPPVDYSLTAPAWTLASGDVNADGHLDLVVVTFSNRVSLLLGRGDGAFRPGDTLPVGQGPYRVVVGDFNGDGRTDLVAGNWMDLSFLPGLAQGGFGSAVSLRTALVRESIDVLVAADFNHDGKPNLVAHDVQNNSRLVVLSVNRDGASFSTRTHDLGTTISTALTGDFNADGNADLVVGRRAETSLEVLLGRSDGSFHSASTNNLRLIAESMTASDFDSDGKADLVVVEQGSDDLLVFLGNGDGTLRSPVRYLAGRDPTTVATADFNGDGLFDLVTANWNGSDISVLPGRGDGTFAPAQHFDAVARPTSLVVGDFDGNGRPDVAMVSRFFGTVTVMLNSTDAIRPESLAVNRFHSAPTQIPAASDQPTPYPSQEGIKAREAPLLGKAGSGSTGSIGVPSSAVTSLPAGKGRGQGKPGSGLAEVHVAAPRAPASPFHFAPAVNYRVGFYLPGCLAVADFDRDGTRDLAVAHGNREGSAVILTVLAGRGDGTFTNHGYFHLPGNSSSTATADFNADGWPDLVVPNSGPDTVSLALGDGHGGFKFQPVIPSRPAAEMVALGDFTDDGRLDLITTAGGAIALSLRPGDGRGGLGEPLPVPIPYRALSVTTGDFDGDGKMDLAVSHRDADTVSALCGRGDGSFRLASSNAVKRGAGYVATGDFNRDGRLDFAVSARESDIVRILLGNGDGTFLPAHSCASGRAPHFVAAADFDNDGNVDLAVANLNASSLTLLRGVGDGTFAPAGELEVGARPARIAVGDFDGDSRIDLAVANAHYASVSVLLNRTESSPGANATQVASVAAPRESAADFFPGGPANENSPALSRDAAPEVTLASLNFRHSTWTTDNGLPHNTVNCLLQTGDGYLWIGTKNGLVRYDGLKMALFNHQTHPEFVNDNVHALAEDPRDGTLWIGTDGGVVRWKAHRMSGWHSEAGSTDHRRVNALAVSRDGGVWVGRGGLSRLREGRLTEYPFPFPATARETSCSPMEALGTC